MKLSEIHLAEATLEKEYHESAMQMNGLTIMPQGHGKDKLWQHIHIATRQIVASVFYVVIIENQRSSGVPRVEAERNLETMPLCCCLTWAPTWQGEYDYAEPLYRLAMEMTEAIHGKNHPDYSDDLNNLAGLLEKQVRPSVCRCSLDAYLDGIYLLSLCCSI